MSKIVMGYFDCKYCGTIKIKGTEKKCPYCGRPKDIKVKHYIDLDFDPFYKEKIMEKVQIGDVLSVTA